MGDPFLFNLDRVLNLELPSGSGQIPPEILAGTCLPADGAPLITVAECRICQDDDSISNMESPCTCRGSLKYAHRKCVQHWCNEKGDLNCEICHQPYKYGYTAAPRPRLEETTIDIGEGWQLSSTPLDLRDPRFLAILEAERQVLEADYDDYDSINANGAVFCRSVALILMALLLFRHAFAINDDEDEHKVYTFLTFFLVRFICFILPCCIIAWAISVFHHRRQSQEATALAATEFAVFLQSEQSRVFYLTLASTQTATRQQEHV